MAKTTGISYCDSTLNLESGCSGCELLEPHGKNPIKTCYAAVIYDEYAGKKGWAPNFATPTIFPERMEQGLKWNDLTGELRVAPNKFWLNKMPRVIFLNDMGDGFDRLLPDDWLAPYIEQMENSPHIFLMLTKRVKRMKEFWARYGRVPNNIWLGASITSNENISRAFTLAEIPAAVKWLSLEPLLERVSVLSVIGNFQWIVAGGESGKGCRETSIKWLHQLRDESVGEDVPFYLKQFGGHPDSRASIYDLPPELRYREMPKWEHLEWSGRSKPKPQQKALFEL